MNDEQFKQLEEYASRKLNGLPLAHAPADLIPSVLKLIAASAKPVGFWAWSMPLRILVSAAAILLTAVSIAGAQQLGDHAAATYSNSALPGVFSAIATLGSGFIVVIKTIGGILKPYASSPWVWLAAGSILATYLLLVASAAAVIQFRKQQHATL